MMNKTGNFVSDKNFSFLINKRSTTRSKVAYIEQTEKYPNMCNTWVKTGINMAKPIKDMDTTRTPFMRSEKRKMDKNGNIKRTIPDASIKTEDMA